MSEQLPLALRWPAHQRFESFVAGANASGVALVRSAALHAEPAAVFVAGAAGSGRTHLLIAACAAASDADRTAQYLDLAALPEPRAQVIRSFHGSQLLAIDNVHAIAGAHAAEHALFDLHNRCRAEGTTLLFAASALPASIGLVLPDLISRLAACAQVVVQMLDERARRSLLQRRASERGIELDDAVVDWLFSRRARDLDALLRLLDRIDRAALAAQRRVTIPFLRSLLAADPDC